MRFVNKVMNISTFELIKASACVAIGWYLGRGIYTVVVELIIKACEKAGRLI